MWSAATHPTGPHTHHRKWRRLSPFDSSSAYMSYLLPCVRCEQSAAQDSLLATSSQQKILRDMLPQGTVSAFLFWYFPRFHSENLSRVRLDAQHLTDGEPFPFCLLDHGTAQSIPHIPLAVRIRFACLDGHGPPARYRKRKYHLPFLRNVPCRKLVNEDLGRPLSYCKTNLSLSGIPVARWPRRENEPQTSRDPRDEAGPDDPDPSRGAGPGLRIPKGSDRGTRTGWQAAISPCYSTTQDHRASSCHI